MSRTLKAIERHLRPKFAAESVERRNPQLVAEWQQRGPETLSGRAFQKLRLGLAPAQSVLAASAAG